MPFVQVFLPPAPRGSDGLLPAPEVARVIAAELGIRPGQVMVQQFTADEGSASAAVAVVRGRRRPAQAQALAALARLIGTRLALGDDSVAVLWEVMGPAT